MGKTSGEVPVKTLRVETYLYEGDRRVDEKILGSEARIVLEDNVVITGRVVKATQYYYLVLTNSNKYIYVFKRNVVAIEVLHHRFPTFQFLTSFFLTLMGENQ